MNALKTDRLRTSPSRCDMRMVHAIQEQVGQLVSSSDDELAARFQSLPNQNLTSTPGSRSDTRIMTQAFALTAESLRRTVGMLAYDVQLLAGIAMSHGSIAEMQTGEGKTLTSAFPITAYSMRRQGVHVATVNAYLAERDYEFLQPALNLLGITTGLSRPGDATAAKRAAYDCDVTFATGYELGFDFLRDQIAQRSCQDRRLGAALQQKLFAKQAGKPETAQRGFAAAIIDEIDSVLIDEAATPLVLSSGPTSGHEDERPYQLARRVAEQLQVDEDFQVQPETQKLVLLPVGRQRMEKLKHQYLQDDQSLSSTPVSLLRPWSSYVESALRAEQLMTRDVNYVVRNDKVEIVDEYTGRIFDDRSWREGLHQAVELKEGVSLTPERRTVARIFRQRYFQRYDALCGMTGTVDGHQKEFRSVYRLPIVIIPRRKPLIRSELPTRYFANHSEKCMAIVDDIKRRHQLGQPILLGTRTIEQSLQLSEMLNTAGVKHQVLNGLQDEQESELISAAGNHRSVTVATNMAGRGTDIQPDTAALASGGLHVIGFERNSSLRIDRQLLGRSGRQGDAGSGQFFVAATDLLIERHGSTLARRLSRVKNLEGVTNREFDRTVSMIQQALETDSEKMRAGVMREELWLDRVKKAAG